MVTSLSPFPLFLNAILIS